MASGPWVAHPLKTAVARSDCCILLLYQFHLLEQKNTVKLGM